MLSLVDSVASVSSTTKTERVEFDYENTVNIVVMSLCCGNRRYAKFTLLAVVFGYR